MKKNRFSKIEKVTEMEKIPTPVKHDNFNLREINSRELEDVIEQVATSTVTEVHHEFSLSDLNDMPLEDPLFDVEEDTYSEEEEDDLDSLKDRPLDSPKRR